MVRLRALNSLRLRTTTRDSCSRALGSTRRFALLLRLLLLGLLAPGSARLARSRLRETLPEPKTSPGLPGRRDPVPSRLKAPEREAVARVCRGLDTVFAAISSEPYFARIWRDAERRDPFPPVSPVRPRRLIE
jgi:hypothetical protein